MALCGTHSSQVTRQSRVHNSNPQYDGVAFDTNSMIGQIHTLLGWEISVQILVAYLYTPAAEK